MCFYSNIFTRELVSVVFDIAHCYPGYSVDYYKLYSVSKKHVNGTEEPFSVYFPPCGIEFFVHAFVRAVAYLFAFCNCGRVLCR